MGREEEEGEDVAAGAGGWNAARDREHGLENHSKFSRIPKTSTYPELPLLRVKISFGNSSGGGSSSGGDENGDGNEASAAAAARKELGLFAAMDLEEGEMMLQEEPLLWLVADAATDCYCANCVRAIAGREMQSPPHQSLTSAQPPPSQPPCSSPHIQCSACRMVYFCSSTCQEAAATTAVHNAHVCSALKRLRELPSSVLCWDASAAVPTTAEEDIGAGSMDKHDGGRWNDVGDNVAHDDDDDGMEEDRDSLRYLIAAYNLRHEASASAAFAAPAAEAKPLVEQASEPQAVRLWSDLCNRLIDQSLLPSAQQMDTSVRERMERARVAAATVATCCSHGLSSGGKSHGLRSGTEIVGLGLGREGLRQGWANPWALLMSMSGQQMSQQSADDAKRAARLHLAVMLCMQEPSWKWPQAPESRQLPTTAERPVRTSAADTALAAAAAPEPGAPDVARADVADDDVAEAAEVAAWWGPPSVRTTALLLSIEKCNMFALMAPLRADGVRRVRGYALYPTACLINHCCYPNVCRYDYLDSKNEASDNKAIQIRAMRRIEREEELCLSYFPISWSLRLRQQRLREEYGFVCRCLRCTREQRWGHGEESSDSEGEEDDGDGSGEHEKKAIEKKILKDKSDDAEEEEEDEIKRGEGGAGTAEQSEPQTRDCSQTGNSACADAMSGDRKRSKGQGGGGVVGGEGAQQTSPLTRKKMKVGAGQGSERDDKDGAGKVESSMVHDHCDDGHHEVVAEPLLQDDHRGNKEEEEEEECEEDSRSDDNHHQENDEGEDSRLEHSLFFLKHLCPVEDCGGTLTLSRKNLCPPMSGIPCQTVDSEKVYECNACAMERTYADFIAKLQGRRDPE